MPSCSHMRCAGPSQLGTAGLSYQGKVWQWPRSALGGRAGDHLLAVVISHEPSLTPSSSVTLGVPFQVSPHPQRLLAFRRPDDVHFLPWKHL